MNTSLTKNRTESELISQAIQLSGCSLGDLAQLMRTSIPAQRKYAKGWLGTLIEQFLGATSASKAQPDFYELGIELKTIPVDEYIKVKESTYVCVAPIPMKDKSFDESLVYHKLKKVLWVPIIVRPEFERSTFLTPFFWEPSGQILATLQQDWAELSELINTGQFAQISARVGEYLQLRPKAANSQVLTYAIDAQGEKVAVVPKGFYLRVSFTQQIINQHFAIDATSL